MHDVRACDGAPHVDVQSLLLCLIPMIMMIPRAGATFCATLSRSLAWYLMRILQVTSGDLRVNSSSQNRGIGATKCTRASASSRTNIDMFIVHVDISEAWHERLPLQYEMTLRVRGTRPCRCHPQLPSTVFFPSPCALKAQASAFPMKLRNASFLCVYTADECNQYRPIQHDVQLVLSFYPFFSMISFVSRSQTGWSTYLE